MVIESKTMPKVAIVSCSTEYVEKRFAMSLAGMVMEASATSSNGPPIPLVLIPIEGALIENNRSRGVGIALTCGADFILQIDADQEFAPWTLRKLLAGAMAGNDIVGAVCPQRAPPHKLTGCWPDGMVLRDDCLNEVEAIGTGCLMVSRRVFEQVPGPHWFKTYLDDNGEYVSEDIGFMKRCRAAGFKVWLDMIVSKHLGHVGRQVNYIDGAHWDARGYTNSAWEACSGVPQTA